MIKQGLSLDGIIDKKFKILRTSIILGNLNNRDEIFNDFEETARELDRIKNGVYEEKLASKMYTTLTLEEEKERLKDIIGCIEERVKEKNEYLDDYIKITSSFLDDLDIVNGEADLNSYKLRLSNIDEYLNNSHEIEEINNKLKELKKELESKYEAKSNNELINSKLEDELIQEFNKYITADEYYASLNYSDIDNELLKFNDEIKEKETVMNTFVSSYEALVNAGISGSEREEYSSYVRDARRDYYSSLEKKFILELYKLVLDKEGDYDKLYEKREQISTILYERNVIRRKLEIADRDGLDYFIKLCDEQFNIIKGEKYILESIDSLIYEIGNLENRLSELEIANNRKEILDILEEFSVSRTVITKEPLPEEKEVVTYIDESYKDGNKPSNMVIKIKEPVKINVKNATDMAKLVMKKVVIVLEPKKFNIKRDKLKEAEEELRKRIEEEKVLTSKETLGIELDTKAVFGDGEVKEINDLNEIKINTDSNNNVKLPTEIFIEEPEEEVQDLFSVTDPFLDDNDIESKKDSANDMVGNMPRIFNIGTVKPNSTFAKIEDAIKENDNVTLPTMGLTDMEKENVPIVSENYIN